jgi:Methyltransferase domain
VVPGRRGGIMLVSTTTARRPGGTDDMLETLDKRNCVRHRRTSAALEAEVTSAAAAFSARVAAASSVAAIEIAHAEFLGSPAVQSARALVDDVDAFRVLTEAAWQGLERFHEICGTANHATTRPLGYPGDFAILELVYDRRPHASSRTAAGQLADAWFASTPLAQAVAARKDLLASILEERALAATRPLRVLSIAAGAARELREMSPRALRNVESTLVDRDPRPLEFARMSLGTVAPTHSVRTVVGNAIKGGELVDEVSSSGPFDVIYSFGLFDYFTDEQILRTMQNFLPLLADGGQVIFCLKDQRYYDWLPADWLYDWRFVPRTADDGPLLAHELGLRVTKTWIVGGRCIAVWACER